MPWGGTGLGSVCVNSNAPNQETGLSNPWVVCRSVGGVGFTLDGVRVALHARLSKKTMIDQFDCSEWRLLEVSECRNERKLP